MNKAIYSPWHAETICPGLRPATRHSWEKSGIIKPAIPSSGAGFPARYTGLNLVEFGIVHQLTRLGVDSHVFLRKLMQHPTSADRPLIEYVRTVHDFRCFLILPGVSAFAQELKEEDKDAGPPHFLRPLEKLVEFFGAHLPTGGWVVVDVGFIKEMVERRLAELS